MMSKKLVSNILKIPSSLSSELSSPPHHIPECPKVKKDFEKIHSDDEHIKKKKPRRKTIMKKGPKKTNLLTM
jgi:hypothetical protein